MPLRLRVSPRSSRCLRARSRSRSIRRNVRIVRKQLRKTIHKRKVLLIRKSRKIKSLRNPNNQQTAPRKAKQPQASHSVCLLYVSWEARKDTGPGLTYNPPALRSPKLPSAQETDEHDPPLSPSRTAPSPRVAAQILFIVRVYLREGVAQVSQYKPIACCA